MPFFLALISPCLPYLRLGSCDAAGLFLLIFLVGARQNRAAAATTQLLNLPLINQYTESNKT